MKLRSTAAVSPPSSMPKNVRLPRPTAISRLARSVAPSSILQLAVFLKARRSLPLNSALAAELPDVLPVGFLRGSQ
jgi:hypothetical protein